MYDSEDKVLIPLDTVSGDKEVEFTVDFSMSILVDDKGEPSQIHEFSFAHKSFLWVDIGDSDLDYK